MPGTTAFPGALDTTTTLPTASTLSGIELDGDGTANNIHSNVHGVTGGAVIALETKLGSGSTTPTATAVLVGSGTGTSAWDTTPTFGAITASTVDATTDFTVGATVITDGVITDASGLQLTADVGIGIASADSNLHVQNATAGSVAAVANTVLTVENNTHAYLSILTPNDTVGGIVFGDVASNVAGRLLYTHDPASPQGFQFYVETSERMRLDSTGTLFVGDTANTNMTQGLTLNQGAADNQILVARSSDVKHVLTSLPTSAIIAGQAVFTDDFFTVGKVSAANGGVTMQFLAKAAIAAPANFIAFGGSGDNTKSTSGVGAYNFFASSHDGANGFVNMAANANLMAVSGRVGGANVTRWILDAEGDTWQTGGATFGGDVTLGENGIILDHAIGTDLAVSGITTTGTAGSSMVVGDVIVLSADNAWDPANADSAAADALGTGMLGISLTAGSSGAINILLQGFIRVDAVYGFTSAGLPLYLDDTAGDMSQTAPSASGDFVRIVGYAHDDDDTIYFNPDNTWVEVA